MIWIPSMISTIFWYDASDLATITSSGNQVTQMLDKSGNGFTLTPRAGFVGPDTGTRTLNGLNVLDYVKTGTSSNVLLENSAFSQAQPFCIAAVMSFDDEGVTTGDQDFLFSGTDASANRIAVRRTTGDAWQIFSSSGNVNAAGALEGYNYIPCFYFNSTASTIRVDGSLLNTGSIANNSFTHLNVGGNYAGGSNLDGLVGELIAFADPNDQEIVEGYLAWKWGMQDKLPVDHLYKNNVPSPCNPKFNKHSHPNECGEKRFRRLRLLGYI